MEYSKTKLPFVSGRKYNNLLKDYEDVVYKLETLLVEVTGKLSKSTYPIDVMLSESRRRTEELGDEADDTEAHVFAVDGFQLESGDEPDFQQDENGGTWTTTFAATITGRAN